MVIIDHPWMEEQPFARIINDWNNSIERFENLLSIHHEYVLRENHELMHMNIYFHQRPVLLLD